MLTPWFKEDVTDNGKMVIANSPSDTARFIVSMSSGFTLRVLKMYVIITDTLPTNENTPKFQQKKRAHTQAETVLNWKSINRHSINQSIVRSIDRSINPSIDQLINQSIYQLINQSINQSINY